MADHQGETIKYLNRAVTRRQAIKAGGIAAVGLAFSKPLIETILPKPAFANYSIPVSNTKNKYCRWNGHQSGDWKKEYGIWSRWNGQNWSNGRWSKWRKNGWEPDDFDDDNWSFGDWWSWTDSDANDETWKEENGSGWEKWEGNSGWQKGNWSWH